MSVTASIVKLEDGPRNAVFHLTAEIGAADEETLVKKIDVTTLSLLGQSTASATQPGGQNAACTHLSLERIQFSTMGLSVRLFWEGPANVGGAALWSLPPNFTGHENFLKKTSPLQNPLAAGTRTGNVLLSTIPFETDPALAPQDGRYDIMLWFRKKYE